MNAEAIEAPTLEDGRVDDGSADRMSHVMRPEDIVEDLEQRQKPPFINIPGADEDEGLTKQQKKGSKGVFDTVPEDFLNCVLVHQYAEPLEVIDSEKTDDSSDSQVYRDWADADQDSTQEAVPTGDDILPRPGAIYGASTQKGNEMHIGTRMFAHL